jgi:Tfp pilus assembly protein PilF
MDKTGKSKISFWQKTILIILGIFLFFVLLEIGLRLGGFIFLSLQEHRNKVSLMQKGEYRIICLGESTTAFGSNDSYPFKLGEVLNQRNTGIKFSVINGGVAGIDTSNIVARLDDNLNKYKPDMVIAMMGINDESPIIPYAGTSVFKVYKLTKLLWLHIVAKLKELYARQANSSQPREPFKLIPKLTPINDKRYLELAVYYLNQRKFSQAEELFQKAIELEPINVDAYVGLGWCYMNQGKFSQAEDLLKKAIELAPKNDNAYLRLGWCFLNQGKFSQAEDLLKKAIELNPKNNEGYTGLGFYYKDQGKFTQAEELFQKAIELDRKNDEGYAGLGSQYTIQREVGQAEDMFKKPIELGPENYNVYLELGFLIKNKGKFSQAEDLFKKAIESDPLNYYAYLGLGWCYKEQGKSVQVEDLLKKAIEIRPVKNDIAYGGLATLCKEMGKNNLAKEYYKKANELRLEYYNPITRSNYQELKEILDKRGIRLVCVQYPVRSVEPLKKIFEGQEGIIFIDNERIFKEAVKKDGYKAYFNDMFGGDFGHCTRKGNRLLAENIANVILKEYFNR